MQTTKQDVANELQKMLTILQTFTLAQLVAQKPQAHSLQQRCGCAESVRITTQIFRTKMQGVKCLNVYTDCIVYGVSDRVISLEYLSWA